MQQTRNLPNCAPFLFPGPRRGIESASLMTDFNPGISPSAPRGPVAFANGCDPAVTALRVNPKGVFVDDVATPDLGFTLRFWVCIP